jgi:hypothetical protein
MSSHLIATKMLHHPRFSFLLIGVIFFSGTGVGVFTGLHLPVCEDVLSLSSVASILHTNMIDNYYKTILVYIKQLLCTVNGLIFITF